MNKALQIFLAVFSLLTIHNPIAANCWDDPNNPIVADGPNQPLP